MHHHKYRLVVPFLTPAIVLYAVFVLWPYAQSFYIALTDWRGVSARRNFVGLQNFANLIKDANFWNALVHNVQLLIALPICTLGIALLFATLFTQGERGVPGARFFRVVFFFSYVMGTPIIGVLWSFIYHPNIGLVNALLGALHLDGLQRTWLGDPATALWAVMAVLVWQAVGFYMVLFIAGIQSIPTTYYEAAVLDGATRPTMFTRITLPLLWDHVQVALVYIGIAALDFFTIVAVMTEGGPNRATDVAAYYMYTTAFRYAQFRYATAMGVSLLLLTLGLAVITLRITQRERIEY
jgi:N-acetylglucosamine transport system permease protein